MKWLKRRKERKQLRKDVENRRRELTEGRVQKWKKYIEPLPTTREELELEKLNMFEKLGQPGLKTNYEPGLAKMRLREIDDAMHALEFKTVIRFSWAAVVFAFASLLVAAGSFIVALNI